MWRFGWGNRLQNPLVIEKRLEFLNERIRGTIAISGLERNCKIPHASYSQWHKLRELKNKSQLENFPLNRQSYQDAYAKYYSASSSFKTPLLASVRCLHSKSSKKPALAQKTDESIEDGDTFGTFEGSEELNRLIDSNRKKRSTRKVSALQEKPDNNQPELSSQEASEDSDLSTSDELKISKLFPEPKCIINQYQTLSQQRVFEITHKQNMAKQKGKMKYNPKAFSWTSTVRLHWPEKQVFEANAFNKTAAEKKAIYKALHFLHVTGRINKQGRPIHDKEAIEDLKKDLNKHMTIYVDDKHLQVIEELIKKFEKDIDPILSESSEKISKLNLRITPDLESAENLEEDYIDDRNRERNIFNLNTATDHVDKIFGIAPENKNKEKMEKRSEYLYTSLLTRPEETVMPITEHKGRVVSAIESNRAVVIQGAPGCGKSTGVPLYLLDEWSERRKGAECGVIVSQPRRVAAVSLANRVASQRGEEVGDAVGHQVRLSTKLPRDPGGGILYCTAGALLRRMASSPDLPGCTHLILDEAHERSIDSDAVMTLAKRCMDLNKKLKVVVMSATIDTKLFSNYFRRCPIVEVPGFMYPVESVFLDQFPKSLTHKLPKAWRSSHSTDEEIKPFLDPLEVVNVIKWVNSTRTEGAILVFLPGWGEIKRVRDLLVNDYDRRTFQVFPIHSRLSNEDQQKIFSKSDESSRKIILATNIAETSITINDVSYVIDTGLQKEIKLLNSMGISTLGTDWVSQANVKQRRGRAGRVKPGECFHMYTEEKMESFDENPMPEILRVPLEKTVLDCKTYTEDDSVLDFLQRFPEPPTVEATETAIKYLVNLGALDDNERLTALGRRIASFSTHPKLSKALVHSAIFKVATPMLDLATILSNNTDLFAYTTEQKEEIRKFKKKYHPMSDHQAMFWLNQHYHEMKDKENPENIDSFCRKNHIRKERLDGINYLREIYVNHLQHSKMLPFHDYEKGQTFKHQDKFANSDELVKGVLYSGLNSLLLVKDFIKAGGKLAKSKLLITDNGHRGFISSDSVNYKIERKLDSAALLYCGAIHSQERRGILAKDTSVLTPLAIFMFSSKVEVIYEDNEKVIFGITGKKLKLETTPQIAASLCDFRDTIWSLVNYYIENEGFHETSKKDLYKSFDEDVFEEDQDESIEGNKTVDDFRNEVLTCLSKMLGEAEADVLKLLKVAS